MSDSPTAASAVSAEIFPLVTLRFLRDVPIVHAVACFKGGNTFQNRYGIAEIEQEQRIYFR